MENLQDKMDELQFQTGVFADLCEFVYFTQEHLESHSNYRQILSSVIRIIRDEAARIGKASDAIFADKRMIEFYYSEELGRMCRQ